MLTGSLTCPKRLPPNSDNDEPVLIGANFATQESRVERTLDDVRVYRRALSAEEIAGLGRPGVRRDDKELGFLKPAKRGL